MSLNNRNTLLAALIVLWALSSVSSQADTPPVTPEPGEHTQAEPARASTWDVLVLDAQRAYWDATRDSAAAQTEALLALRTLAVAQKDAQPTATQPPISTTTPLPRRIEAPTFDWQLVSVGRGADGRRYAVLSDGAARKRVAHKARLDGWTVTITATGTVVAQHGGFKVDVE